jgi:hypothetical protein
MRCVARSIACYGVSIGTTSKALFHFNRILRAMAGVNRQIQSSLNLLRQSIGESSTRRRRWDSRLHFNHRPFELAPSKIS